jgi:mersacidin/lichenicidin family type 2 lantibiotic
MDIETQIRAWKDPKFRATLNAEELSPNPAGLRLLEIDEEELRGLWGAMAPVSSEGYVCSVSGECNGGKSCWSAVAES